MRNAILLLIIFIGCRNESILAQVYYNRSPEFLNANSVWCFFDSIGLDFNEGTLSVISSNLTSINIPGSLNSSSGSGAKGSASVSDPVTGDLLFYSDGYQCWNSNGQIMPNGDSLYGNGSLRGNLQAASGIGNLRPTRNAVQGVCIVPFISDPRKYYLFSLVGGGNVQDTPIRGSLFYSIVDMDLAGGLGDIVSGQKNIPLDTASLHEGMIAIPGGNQDIWLMTHAINPWAYKAYHITSSGIDPNPVISITPGIDAPWSNFTQQFMVISPDRTKLAMSTGVGIGRLTVSKFDPCTGEVSDEIMIDTFNNMHCKVTALAFSSDNNKLYAVNHFSIGFDIFNNLVQFDVSTHNVPAINASKNVLLSYNNYNASDSTTHCMRLYNDTIYIKPQSNATTNKLISYSINRPNLTASACELQLRSILIPPTTPKASVSTFPTEVVYPVPPVTNILDTVICLGASEGISLNPMISHGSQYEWSDGSHDSFLTVYSSGSYYVSYSVDCKPHVDSFFISSVDLNPQITVSGLDLGTVIAYASYQWMLNGSVIPNANNRNYTVLENGDYQVIVSDGICIDTSAVYTVTNVNIEDVNDLYDQITIYPNPSEDIINIKAPFPVDIRIIDLLGKAVREQSSVNQISIDNLNAGSYIIQIGNKEGIKLKCVKFVKLN